MKGGEKLLAMLAKIGSALGGDVQVQVGFLPGSTAGWNGPRPMKPRSSYASSGNFKRAKARFKNVTVNAQGGSQPAAYIASIMEYGDPGQHIPPRPFFSTMIKMNRAGWHEFLARELKRMNYDAHLALESLGIRAAEQLKDSILMGDWVALKEATIKAKGFDTPLIDSHNMINSVDFAVL